MSRRRIDSLTRGMDSINSFLISLPIKNILVLTFLQNKAEDSPPPPTKSVNYDPFFPAEAHRIYSHRPNLVYLTACDDILMVTQQWDAYMHIDGISKCLLSHLQNLQLPSTACIQYRSKDLWF